MPRTLCPIFLLRFVNAALILEPQHHDCAEPFERMDIRNGYACRFTNRTLIIRHDTLELNIPQVRGNEYAFSLASLNAAMASEKTLRIALAAIYNQGVAPPQGDRCWTIILWRRDLCDIGKQFSEGT